MEAILDAGIWLILLLQSLGDWLIAPMKFFTYLGNEEFYLLIAPILYWCIDTQVGLRMALILIFSDGLNNIFKVFLHAPRPYWVNTQVRALSAETSFGIPSGHAQNAAAVWGALAVWLRQRWAWVAGGALIFFIGVSRIFLGVHFPSDVLAGWLLGILILWAFLKYEPAVRAWLGTLSTARQILAALGTSLALILLGILAHLSLGSWMMPAEWQQNASQATGVSDPIHPLAYSGLITDAGALFGLATGAMFIALYGGFEARGALWKRVLRFLIGLVGVLIAWRGLSAVMPGGETLLALILRWARYALVGFWVTGLVPWLFVRIGLATKKEQI